MSIVEATMKAHGKDYGVSNVEGGVEFYFEVELDKKCEVKDKVEVC